MKTARSSRPRRTCRSTSASKRDGVKLPSTEDVAVVHGFTHGLNCFVIALAAGQGGQQTAVRDAAERAIRRIRAGERALAYHPGCGTSEVVSAVSLWLVYVTSMLMTFIVGGSVPVFFAISVLVFRLWLAAKTALGLLAQRLYTVSTSFASARVIEVREASKMRGISRPPNETWFEVRLDVRFDATEGGVVAPGALS